MERLLSLDLPQPTNVDPLTGDALHDHSEGYRMAFELATHLGAFQDESQAEAIATTALAMRGANHRLWEAIFQEKGGLSVEKFATTGMSAAAICGAMNASLESAGHLEDLVGRLYIEQNSDATPTPLTDQLRAEQQDPTDIRHLMQLVRETILRDTFEILDNFSDMLMERLRWKKGLDPKAVQDRQLSIEGKKASLMADGTSRIENMETLLQVVRNPDFFDIPDIDINELSLLNFFMRIANTYHRWWTMNNNPMPDDVPRPGPTQAAKNEPPEPESAAETLAAAKAELIRLIGMHAAHVKRYRPAWSQLKAAFRNLELAMRRTPLESRQANVNFDQASRRLIGIMTVLAAQGSTSDQDPDTKQAELQTRLTNFFTFEQAINVNIRTEQWALHEAGAEIDIGDWAPVEDDFCLLHEIWPSVRSLVKTNWPRAAGKDVVAAITNTLQAFDAYRRILTDPEQYLKTIATHLGATALRPQARPEKSSETRIRKESEIELAAAQRQRAVGNALEEIINNQNLPKNDRQRAEVLKYFLVGTGKPQLPFGDMTYPGFFYTEPTKEQPLTYFGVEYDEWLVIETLPYGWASYAFRKKLIEQQGEGVTLGDFLSLYNKTEIVRMGGIKVRHIDGWTPESHILRIKQRIARAEARALQTSF